LSGKNEPGATKRDGMECFLRAHQASRPTFMRESERRDIAARLRGLIGGQHTGELAEVARRLGVDEMSLRISIDPDSPYPTLDVLTAVVGHYGIDPAFLLKGQYDGASHRRVLDDPRVASKVVRELAFPAPAPRIAAEPEEPPHLHLA
jgi:hypothetical protein